LESKLLLGGAKMKKKVLVILSICVFFAALSFAADTYVVDPAHTNVGFTVRHLVISNVHGNFKDFTGTIIFDEKDPSACSITGSIRTNSVNTGNENRDKDLKSDNFFDEEKYPEITFKSTKVEKMGDAYQVTGDLTIRGVTKEVSFPVEVSGPVNAFGTKKIGIEFSLTINRQDYGLKWNKTLESGGLVVGDDVKIDISAEAGIENS
jgi:polyisoprenoid-binding protein YceI